MQNMSYYETIHDSYWEEIRVERMLKWSCLRKAKMQEEKLLQTTEAHVVENVRVDTEVQDQVKGEVVASSKEKIEVDMEIQEPENRGIDRVDQLLQVENEEANSKETNKEFDHMMDPISSPPLENQIKPSDEKTIDQEIVKEGSHHRSSSY
eukprot:TRINITY_DN720_c1_g1_i2.p1 TRINITY_DN720_c1_g1~~TRINITY_DN720_c1_g1_i2.p1  ORF type:complete len:151 (+),score=36.99 TRINITY_DN720_c1_g1_i2:232-684(+)